MNVKENALRIIHFDHPEWVMKEPPLHRLEYLGANHEGYAGGGHHLPAGSVWTDIWGTGWHKELEGVMGFPRAFPLANLAQNLGTYSWPNPDDGRLCAPIYRIAESWNPASRFLFGSHRDTLWEKAYMLVGMEDLMVYFKTEPNAVKELLHHIMDFQLGIARHYFKAWVEMIGCSDDLGTQNGLLFSPKILNEFFIPEYRRLFSLYKSHGVLINFHSCGHISPLLDTFMDLGIDILNPVQASANDLDQIRRATLGRMALSGGVSSALIVSGPKEAIRSEVAKRIWQLGQQGGYFCAPDQGMPWLPENERALDLAVEEFGRYPLEKPFQT